MKAENKPYVSVCMITYNHARYVEQAIEGVMRQVTNFAVELIIGEDCSTDNTREIIEAAQARYPNRIKLVKSNSNVGAQSNFIRVYEICTGKYIAMCEGDDYWTDSSKLQKQVEFMEANTNFSICFHNMTVIYESGRQSHSSNSSSQRQTTTCLDLSLGNYIYTASCVFRNHLIKTFPKWFSAVYAGDYCLHMMNAKHGSIHYMNDNMGVYRVHDGGVWSELPLESKIYKWISVLNNIKFYYNTNSYVDVEVRKRLNFSKVYLLSNVLKQNKLNYELLEILIKDKGTDLSVALDELFDDRQALFVQSRRVEHRIIGQLTSPLRDLHQRFK